MSASTILSTTNLPPVRPVECRDRERQPCGLQTSCQPIAARGDKDVQWPATILDISVEGAGVVLDRRFERGAGLAIEVPGTRTQPGDTLLAKVVHTTALPGGRWLLGCIFVSELSDDDLLGVLALARAQQAFMQEEDALAEESGGRHSRKQHPVSGSGRYREVLIPGVNFEGTSNDGRVARVPVRRLFLSGTWPVPPGTVLKVKVAGQMTPLPEVKLKANSCVLGDGCWTLNYTFLEKPPVEILTLFGYTPSLMDF